jgi:hypothetical protein
MNPAIKKFLEANAIARRAIIRCGFELETQATGCDAIECGEDIDHDAANDAIGDQVDEIIGRSLENHVSDRIMNQVREAVWDSVSSDFDYSDYKTDINELLQNEIDSAVRNELRKYSTSSNIDKPKIECGKDGSVDGYEFRTIGALTYAQFVIASRAAFSLDHRIDENCSYHIHLSIPGVKHSYGDRFQLALVEYLIENIHRIPKTVRKRWKNAPQNQYIKGLLSSKNKYSFVYAHEQGTWEFRCFGNVHNTKDGLTCLNIAIEAMAHAYQVTQQGKSLLTDSYGGDLHELFSECLICSMPVSKQLRHYRKLNQSRQSA